MTRIKTNKRGPLKASGDFAGIESGSSPSFFAAWHWWLPPALLSLALILYFVDPFVGDWDAYDYTILSLAGYPSSMALGRNLFIFWNHGLYHLANTLFQVQPEDAYLIFKYAVVAQGPLAVIASWALAREVVGSLHAATLAALFVVFSPVFVLYGGQVMTDVPSVLFLALALTIHLRGLQRQSWWLVLASAALLGLGVNLRETVAFYAPWLVLAPFVCGWKPSRRTLLFVAVSVFVFLLFSLSWFGYWFLTDPHYRWVWNGWRQSMAQESARHPVTINNLKPYLVFFFISAPLILITLPFAAVREWLSRGLSPVLLLAVVGLFANILLFFNYSTAVNWRYFLTGLPALAPLSASFLMVGLTGILRSRRVAFASCAVLLAGFAIFFSIYMKPMSREYVEKRALSKEYREQLVKLPHNAVMMSGGQTIAVKYWAAIGSGDWETIGTGGGWPAEHLIPIIDGYLAEERPVFIDTDPHLWSPCSWQRYEIPAIVDLEQRFNFRQVTETIYELRPLSDDSALDVPQLERLLPENRPEETIGCPPTRS
ncbi:MAG TPA: glycosyltransferase family 39 protein [Pyrinomonadaceae bacterium]|nr:glycosyltransferase family 39 protein [Pyrinomonadaceae bacterium]